MHLSIKHKNSISLLGGLSFFLSAIEFLIPKPLPFIRVGIANLPMLLGLEILPFSAYLLLVLIKVLGQALITGTLFSYVFIFSLGGTLVSALIMAGFKYIFGKKISLTGISTAGAMTSNIVQLYLAYILIFGNSVRYMAAPILGFGILTGALLGYITEYFKINSKWYKSVINDSKEAFNFCNSDVKYFRDEKASLTSRQKRENYFLNMFNANELALTGFCMLPALLFNPDTFGRIFQCLFFVFLAWFSGKKIRILFTFLVVLCIVFFNLLIPHGEVLFSISSFNITMGALLGGLRRAMTLTGLIMLSRFCIRWNYSEQSFNMTGIFGKLITGAFEVFYFMGEKRFSLLKNNWIAGIDDTLFSIEEEIKKEHKGKQNKNPLRSSIIVSRLLLLLILIIAWIPFIIAFN